jgi:hypothetical protein
LRNPAKITFFCATIATCAVWTLIQEFWRAESVPAVARRRYQWPVRCLPFLKPARNDTWPGPPNHCPVFHVKMSQSFAAVVIARARYLIISGVINPVINWLSPNQLLTCSY